MTSYPVLMVQSSNRCEYLRAVVRVRHGRMAVQPRGLRNSDPRSPREACVA